MHDRAKMADGLFPLPGVQQQAGQVQSQSGVVRHGLHGAAQAGQDGRFRVHGGVLTGFRPD
jgi:hypothetical protein